MEKTPERILIIQTAFIGDAVLTLPLAQAIKNAFPSAHIDVVATPRTAEVFEHHPAITEVYRYDKRKTDAGLSGFLRLERSIRRKVYDLALIPHRSLRSALLAWAAGIPRRIGFDRSAGQFLFTDVVRYESAHHEIERNLSLLEPLEVHVSSEELPRMYPSGNDREAVDAFLAAAKVQNEREFIALAPGSIWKTKRWIPERFGELAAMLEKRFTVFLIGGKEDMELCEGIRQQAPSAINCAGALTVRQSAELLRRCRLVVTNDSAPMHLAVAVGTPVIAIYGATVPEFGFAPRGTFDVVLEKKGLPCRPCGIHGGHSCPIKTFDCMKSISVDTVFSTIGQVLQRTNNVPRKDAYESLSR